MKIIIACGGTGGHLFPGIAVAEELQRRGHEPVLLISEKKVDAEASAKYTNLRFEVMPAIAKPPTLSPKMLGFMLRLVKTIGQCKALLKKEQADAVLGMGGFTSFAPIYAGKKLGLRTYVHDSNAVPGKSNVMTGKYCTKVLLGLEAAKTYFPARETEITGTPVRGEMHQLPSRADAAAKWGLDAEKPTLLVFGGSQGARGLNSLVLEASASQPDWQVLHVAGQGDYERVREEAKGREGYAILAFCDDMPAAYALADAVVCRSGASSLTEIAHLGLPSILVPYPYAADDHQTANAKVFADQGAALMEQEKDLDGEKLAAMIADLMPGGNERESIAAKMKALGEKDAAATIADVVAS
ncbi:MAG: undecaprenyldiphospho-muramoylpentapeptide beta-N-acetylglucosaminyltransferase [Verrucomicrobiota bacterium JB023]|nr:undecaprenyldiphospho-muramoylpentapeptide beta-N-acetylglucosaminyltransferase [Verrucomicrobiota bacterium JB023]